MEKRSFPRRAWGLLACAVLSGGALWSYGAGSAPMEPVSGPASSLVEEGESGARTNLRVTEPARPLPRAVTAATLPEAQEIQARLLVAHVRHSLERSWRRASGLPSLAALHRPSTPMGCRAASSVLRADDTR